jgi:DNA-binding CsgD family transcriptional regulator
LPITTVVPRLIDHPPFVGRGRELAALLSRLGAAREGHSSVAIIGGEPGIGKTRLMLEVAARARAGGWRVLSGRAYEAEGMPPYLPFVEALRPYIRACPLDALAAQLGAGAANVALLVPELRDRLPDLPPGPAPDAEYGRYRLFESVAHFLLAAARASPPGLVLCLDDLQWADRPSLLLLRHLARSLAPFDASDGFPPAGAKGPDYVQAAPALVVGTYRTVDLDRAPSLASVLADLEHEGLSERQLLTPFSPAEAADLIAGVTGTPAAQATADAICRETGGNPFFLGQVVRHLHAQGRDLSDPRDAHVVVAQWGIPEGVREAIGQRLSRLSAAANRLLRTGAVAGERFTFEVLEAAGGTEAGPLMDALDEAIGTGMLVEEGAGYHFTHALVRQTLYDELGLARKQRLHLQVALAIERVYARTLRPHVGALALHYRLAGPAADPAKALAYTRQAAEAAAGVFAWEEAAAHWQTGLTLVNPEDSEQRCDLLLALGRSLVPAGEPRRVLHAVAPEALALAEALGDGRRAWQVCQLALTALGTSAGTHAFLTAEGRAWVARADRYAAPRSADRVRVDGYRSSTYSALEESAEVRALRRRALALARDLADAEALALAATYVLREEISESWEERLRLAEEIASRPREGVGSTRIVLVLQACAVVLIESGQRARAEALWHEIAALAQRYRDPNLITQHLRGEATLALLDGRLDSAAAALAQLVVRAGAADQPVNGRVNAAQVVLRPLLHLGQAEAAVTFYAEFREMLSEEGWRSHIPTLALCLAHAGRRDEARDTLRRFLANYWVGTDTGASILVRLLETAILVEDREAAAALRPWAVSLASHATAGPDPTCVARHLGAAAALLEDWPAAHAYSEQALIVADRVRFRPEIALARLQLAELALTDGQPPRPSLGTFDRRAIGSSWTRTPASSRTAARRAEAQAHLEFAIAECRAMQMQPALDRALALQSRVAAHRGAAAPYPGGLSVREVEVLRLLASGQSNREIAAALVITVHTVQNHLASIYAKVGARGRVDATAFALRHGFVAPLASL